MEKYQKYYQYMYSYPHKKAYYDISDQDISKAVKEVKDKNLTLYIHIPFCSSKCGYCNLFSIPVGNDRTIIEEYIHSVCRQIIGYAPMFKKDNILFTDIVIGGGTPFILPLDQMKKLLQTIEEELPIHIVDTNFVIETSPNETSLEKLLYFKEKGVKRISIGIQSFLDSELKLLYRKHTVTSCENALKLINEVGFDCVNIDLIYGIEGQTTQSFLYSIHEAVSYRPHEIFIYPLYIREDTGLYDKMKPNESLQYELYQLAVEELIQLGYKQTSMRRFVKLLSNENPSCGFEQMISFGCGGRSYIGDLHFCEPYTSNISESKKILGAYNSKQNYFSGLKGYVLDKEEHQRRYIIKNLGFYKGIDLLEYQNIFEETLVNQYPMINQLLEEGMVSMDDKTCKLTKLGMGNSDMILSLFISEEVKEKMNLC